MSANNPSGRSSRGLTSKPLNLRQFFAKRTPTPSLGEGEASSSTPSAPSQVRAHPYRRSGTPQPPEIIVTDKTGSHVTASGKPVTSTSTQQAGSSDAAATSTSSAPDVEMPDVLKTADDDRETYTAQFVATLESFKEDLQAASQLLE